jgi:lipoprotein-releasing system ATP-binding protein
MTILRADTIHKIYRIGGNEQGVHVLKGISLSILKGEMIAVVGPSGAGKSTLLHILGGLDRPTEGSVTYGGVNIATMSDTALAEFRNRRVGFIFQFHHLLPEFTAAENVAMPALIQGVSLKKALHQAQELLEKMGVSHRSDHHPSELSGGEQQRVAVARSLINQPSIILADEPSGNLDSKNADLLHDLLHDLNTRSGITLVIVTHNTELAAKASKVIKLIDGTIAMDNSQ